MTGTSIEVAYWDTCIFYAFLKREKHKPGELEGIIEEYEKMRDGKLRIVTSTITIAEVARGNFESPQDYDKFMELRFSDDFDFVQSSIPVCELASEIKDYYFNNPVDASGNAKIVGLGDAMHLATAILHNADSFVTLDQKHKKDDSREHDKAVRQIGLLRLGGIVADKHRLNIRRPIPPQQSRLFDEAGE